MLRLSASSLLEEKALEGRNHLVVSCKLIDNKNKIPSYAMINNNVTGYAFIDEDYVRYKNLPLHKLEEPRGLEVFDGTPTTSEDITHVTKV